MAHECVIDIRGIQEEHGVTNEDIAKRLIDFGFHAPTMSFPVAGTLMIEPTETESRETLDEFANALLQIADEARNDPELLLTAPHITPSARMDEVQAARQLVLCCRPSYLADPQYVNS